jgi:hypothetical protein
MDWIVAGCGILFYHISANSKRCAEKDGRKSAEPSPEKSIQSKKPKDQKMENGGYGAKNGSHLKAP